MLQIKSSDAEIQRLKYERYYYLCPIVQKRIHALYLKTTTEMSNKMIGALVGLNRDSVGNWIVGYEQSRRGVDSFKFPMALAAFLRAIFSRLLPLWILLDKTFPPLTLLFGASLSQDTDHFLIFIFN